MTKTRVIEIVMDELNAYDALDDDEAKEIAECIGDKLVKECPDVYDDSDVADGDADERNDEEHGDTF